MAERPQKFNIDEQTLFDSGSLRYVAELIAQSDQNFLDSTRNIDIDWQLYSISISRLSCFANGTENLKWPKRGNLLTKNN